MSPRGEVDYAIREIAFEEAWAQSAAAVDESSRRRQEVARARAGESMETTSDAGLEPIVTSRVLLRAWRPQDAPLLREAIAGSLAELQQWMPWAAAEPSPLPATQALLAKFRDDFVAARDWHYGVFTSDQARVLGGAGLHPRRGPGVLEIGYWIRTDATGQGLASEVARALTRVAFERHRVRHVEIRCDPRNERSAAVPQRLGFRHVATLFKDALTPQGAPRDTMVWVLDRADFQALAEPTP